MVLYLGSRMHAYYLAANYMHLHTYTAMSIKLLSGKGRQRSSPILIQGKQEVYD